MPSVITVGELLVEIMRPKADLALDTVGEFIGPFPSGAPANFVDCVSRLGVDAGIVGAVGDDAFGRCVVDRLARDGVDISCVRTAGRRSTGVAFVTYSADGSREFLFHMADAAAGTIGPADVPHSYVTDADAIHINGSSLLASESMRDACFEALDVAIDNGLLVSFDPNVRMELLGENEGPALFEPVLDRADIVASTAEELAFVANTTNDCDETTAVETLLDRGISTVAVKRGAEGCRIHTTTDAVDHSGFDVEEVDPTGAGDAFAAALVVGNLEDRSLEDVAAFANATGAHAVTAMGPMEGLATREQISELVETGRIASESH